jgi:probable HAF family extracellular repeat protein
MISTNFPKLSRLTFAVPLLLAAPAAQAAYIVTDLGTLGGNYSYAYSINDSGQVVGESDMPGGITHAFSYTPGGGTVDLGTLGGTDSYAYSVNNNGQVVGDSYTSAGNIHAFRYSAGGVMADLGTLGGTSSMAFGINDSGQVVGGAQRGERRTIQGDPSVSMTAGRSSVAPSPPTTLLSTPSATRPAVGWPTSAPWAAPTAPLMPSTAVESWSANPIPPTT